MNKSEEYTKREADFFEYARKHIVSTDKEVACQGRMERDVVVPLGDWIVAEKSRGTSDILIVSRLVYLIATVVGVSAGRLHPDDVGPYRKLVDSTMDRAMELSAELEQAEAERDNAGTE